MGEPLTPIRNCGGYGAYKQRMLRPVSEVADMETRLGLAPGLGRPVGTLIQSSSTAGVTTWVSLVIWLRRACCRCCLARWSLFCCQEGWGSEVRD